MSRIEPLGRIKVGIVVERRRANSAWADFVWRPVSALPGVPDAAPGTVIESDAECTRFYGGVAQIELYRADVPGYRENLIGGGPLLWVVLRPSGRELPYEVAAVTAEPGEGEAFAESTTDIVDTVPMPGPVCSALAEFVATHEVEYSLAKRKCGHLGAPLGATAKVRK
jgi:Protein of unknown function (DUF3305)